MQWEEPSLEERAKEILAVLDAAGSDDVALLANSVGGLLAMFFAASYPQRTSALILDGCYARLERAPDYPFGVPRDLLEPAVGRVGAGAEPADYTGLRYTAPHALQDAEFVNQWSRVIRSAASPARARANAEATTFGDVRPALSTIQAPTLVLYRKEDRFTGKPYAEYLAEHIEGSTLVEVPGEDNLLFVGACDTDLDEIEEFLTGVRHSPDTNRVLATVLFTDIVGSTEHAAKLGDKQWRALLDRHDQAVRRQIERFGGREVNTVGDGFLATFDGPGRAIHCACAIRDVVGALGIEVRAGLHAGEVEVRGDDVAGMAVHIGARVAALAGPGEVLVSGAVPPLVAGSNLAFDYRGEHQLKGVPGFWKVFAVGAEAAR
jgi:class 3 adenylate cyclase